jgi:hypothetical protein
VSNGLGTCSIQLSSNGSDSYISQANDDFQVTNSNDGIPFLWSSQTHLFSIFGRSGYKTSIVGDSDVIYLNCADPNNPVLGDMWQIYNRSTFVVQN